MQRCGGDRLVMLDELRGIAILMVVLSHLPVFIGPWSSGSIVLATPALGVGVDLFFVISGFVIVGSLDRLQAGASSHMVAIGRFYLRRIAWIVPLAWLLAAAGLVAERFVPVGFIAPGDVLSAVLHAGESSFVAPIVVSAVIGATIGVNGSLEKHASVVPEAVAQLGSFG